PIERAVVSQGTNTLTLFVMMLGLPQDLVEPLGRDAAVNRLIDHDGRRACAVAEAIDGLERVAPVGRRAVEVDCELLARVLLELTRTHRLAGLGAAEIHDLLAGRLRAEEVVERDDAV